MQHSIFISDLHLCDSRPHITDAFVLFLEQTAVNAENLYILGDLFEYWPGDDAIADDFQQASITALKNLSARGVKVFFMAGNRDFLLGDAFASATGITILYDPSLLNLYANSVLLSHGDALCTDDVAYIAFRNKVRDAAWQQAFLSQPLSQRIDYIKQLRTKSEQEKSIKNIEIMDVNALAVQSLIRINHYPTLFIHGHTHRPRSHIVDCDSHITTRIVLGDWYEHGSYLRLDKNGFQTFAL